MTADAPDPSPQETWLAWARSGPWHFESYYKYAFTFTRQGRLRLPSGHIGWFTATITAGGDEADIYKFRVAETMTLDEILQGGDWTLTVRENGPVIFSTDPYLVPAQPAEGEPEI